jgi:hypothetical protein
VSSSSPDGAGTQFARSSLLLPQLLAILVRGDLPSADEQSVVLEQAGEAFELDTKWLDCGSAMDTRWWLLTALLRGELPISSDSRVSLRGQGDGFDPVPLANTLTGLPQLAVTIRQQLSGEARVHAQRFLATTPARHGIELTDELAAQLFVIREEVRARLPQTVVAPGPLSARLEQIVALSDTTFWLTGWLHAAAPRDVALTAVSPEGVIADVQKGAVTFHDRPAYARGLRDDDAVSTLGFHALVELPSPSRHSSGWILEFRTATGNAVQDPLRAPVSPDTSGIFDLVLEPLRGDQDELVLERQVLPALTRLRNAPYQPRIEQILAFGEIPPAPEVSLVVAVRRIDRIEHQLVQFVHDPELADCELIFLAPDSADKSLLRIADELHELHGIPFRVAALSARAPRPRTLNLGASIALGSLLVLMSGDVFPAAPGWIGAMRELYRSSPAIAAVGPKLLYEDDSIAHAGVDYVWRRVWRQWERTLPFAGLARTLPAIATPRQVKAVSDACMMIEREQFWACGGFSELYLGGGDESGELCMMLAAAGLESWYAPDAELYLLDRPDRPAKPSPAGTRFNAWLFNRRWGRSLEAGSPRQSSQAPAPISTRIPTIPWTGSQRLGDRIEIIDIEPAASSGDLLIEGALRESDIDPANSPYAGTYSFALHGTAIGSGGEPLTIEARTGSATIARAIANLPSPQAAANQPEAPQARASSFQLVIGSLSLPLRFELEVDAVGADGSRAPLGRVRGRRKPLRSSYSAALEPILLTTLGRTGSTWVITLLGQHPEIVACESFQYEGMLTHYWIEVLRSLAEPASYMQGVLPELYEGDWWLGRGRQSPLPLRKPDTTVPRWLGSENIEVIAGFCQSRLDAVYRLAAEAQGTPSARYFVEKCMPGMTQQLVSELYPAGREIVLVRDFRDWACSILDFNERRGFELWGRDQGLSDEDWFRYLRVDAAKLRDTWKDRQESTYLIRYEDVIRNPVPTLAGVFDYLGVDAGSATIEHVVDASRTVMPDAQAAHRTSDSFESSIGRWRSQFSPEWSRAFAQVFDDLLVDFGYEATADHVAR